MMRISKVSSGLYQIPREMHDAISHFSKMDVTAAIPNALFVEYIPSLDAVLTKPLQLHDGHFEPSQEPGLGIPFDWDHLDAYSIHP